MKQSFTGVCGDAIDASRLNEFSPLAQDQIASFVGGFSPALPRYSAAVRWIVD